MDGKATATGGKTTGKVTKTGKPTRLELFHFHGMVAITMNHLRIDAAKLLLVARDGTRASRK